VVRHNRSDTSQSGPDLNKAVVDPEIDHVVTNFSVTHIDHLVNTKENTGPRWHTCASRARGPARPVKLRSNQNGVAPCHCCIPDRPKGPEP